MKEVFVRLTVKILYTVIIILILIGGVIYFKNHFWRGILKNEYAFVIKEFTKKNELVIGDAKVETSTRKTFTLEMTDDWPKWTEPFTKALVSRTIEMKIPVKTEFKLVLKNITKDDILIKNKKIYFKKPLIINVDSQVDGEITILKSSSGIVDKAVDIFTAGQKAQEFFIEKSQNSIYETTKQVIENKETTDKILLASKEALEEILNITSDVKYYVDLKEKDLILVNIDSKG